ncbi:MAG TPA: leucine-rich repeat protein, partial [Clostridia bacterium]|nr:leucine-rich repeat protein [Clostridia bacterium]
PKTVTKIEDYAFYYCYELQKVNMYNNVTHIGDFAFSYCWNLRELRLSDNLTTLGKEALSHNYDLTKIYLPKNITSIGEDALLGSQSSPGYEEFYFVDGIYCVKNSYAESYVKGLRLTPTPIDDLRHEPDNGIYISSNFLAGTNVYSNTVTSGESFDTAKTFVEKNKNYYGFNVYTLGAKLNGADAILTDNVDIYIPAGKYPSLLKVFKIEAGELVTVNSQIVSPFSDGKKYIKFTSNSLGSFAVAEYFKITKGDVNGDGKITVSDARLALRTAVSLETLHPAQFSAADLDKSGTIGITEARKILRVAVNLESFD